MPLEVLNTSRIQELRDLENEEQNFLALLLEAYLEDLVQFQSDLKQAYRTQDSMSFKGVVHAIKSSSSNLGAEKLIHLCSALELNFREGS